MVSLLCLSVLLSGVLQSYATINLNSSAFKDKLQTLPASVPVYIILSSGYNASISDVRSTLNEVENSGERIVYLYEIFGTAVPLSTRSECLNRNSRAPTVRATGSAARTATDGKPRTNQSNIRTLEVIKNLITSTTYPRPILVVSIYSEFNLKQVKYIKCWIRDVLSGRRLIVSKVKYQDSVLPKAVDRNGSTAAPPRNRTSNVLKPSATEKPAVQSEPEVDSSDSGTVFWVSSGLGSKPNSGLLTRRSTTQDMKDRNERSISDTEEDNTAQNLPPDPSGSTGARNTEAYGENTQDDCQLRDTCAFSFAQSRTKVESVEPSPNPPRTEPKEQKSRDDTNIELSTDDFHATGPSHGHKIHDERVDSSREPSRFDGRSYSKQDNIVDGGAGYEKPTLISSSEGDTKEESSGRNSLNNFPSTQRSTEKKLKLPPIDPVLDDVPEGSDNLYKLNYDINKWPVIDTSPDVSKSGIENIVKKVKDAAKSSVNKIKSGFRTLKEFGNDSYHKFINFFSGSNLE